MDPIVAVYEITLTVRALEGTEVEVPTVADLVMALEPAAEGVFGLKAKLEFIDSGDTTLDRELLPYRVLADGRTLEEAIGTNGFKMLAAGKTPA